MRSASPLPTRREQLHHESGEGGAEHPEHAASAPDREQERERGEREERREREHEALEAERERAARARCTVPESPTSGFEPLPRSPAAMLATVSRRASPIARIAAASALPAKSSKRLRDRVSAVFQVPWRSSAEKRSPATSPARTGKPQEPAKPRMTSGIAKPDGGPSGRRSCRRAPQAGREDRDERERAEEADGGGDPGRRLGAELDELDAAHRGDPEPRRAARG